MELSAATPFLASHQRGVLLTQKRDGRPQASNIVYGLSDGIIRISVTDDRAKTRNIGRDPRVSLHVTSDNFWSYVVVEGTAELSAVTTRPADEPGAELAELYEMVSGKPHPDWSEFHEAMVRDRRLVIRIRPERVYGQLQG
jgi:PPOX class probable F420-dependent enzyme